MTNQQPAKRPAFSNLDVEGGNGGVVWENTNSKTGKTFLAVKLDCLADVEGVDITLNDNKKFVEGGKQPEYYGKSAVAWLGSSKNAGIPTLTVKLTDDALIAAAGGRTYHELFDNSKHAKKSVTSNDLAVVPSAVPATTSAAPVDTADMTVSDMRAHAEAHSISLTGLRLRADIEAAINQS